MDSSSLQTPVLIVLIRDALILRAGIVFFSMRVISIYAQNRGLELLKLEKRDSSYLFFKKG